MAESDKRYERQFYRIKYPISAQPVCLIGGQEFRIVELAEVSMRLSARNIPNERGSCTGTIAWPDGTSSEFSGILGPVRRGQRVLVNVQGIRFSRVLNEQRRLINGYLWPRSDGA